MTKMKSFIKRITAMLLSGMLVIGSASGSVLAAGIDADPSQTSEVAEDVLTEEPAYAQAEEVAEEASSEGETAGEEIADTSEEEAVKSYAVTLDANGGFFENEWDDAVGDYVEQAKTVTRYIPVGGTVPATVVPMYVDPEGQTILLAGWSLESDGEVVSLAEEEYVPVDSCILYAVWETPEEDAGEVDTETGADEDAGLADTEQEAEAGYGDGEPVEEAEEEEAGSGDTETAEETDTDQKYEDTEDTEGEDTIQESEAAEDTNTAQETEEDTYTASETDNEQETASARKDIYSDEEEEETSEGAVDASVVESSEEEETVSEDAVNGIVDSGTCGENLTWILDEEGTLTISGTGEMTDYYEDYIETIPWWEKTIKSVIINNGVTSIGGRAFCDLDLSSVTISSSVTSIGRGAFEATDLESLT